MARREGETSGDGVTSPFGNGNGAPQATGSVSGAANFTVDPTGGRGNMKMDKIQGQDRNLNSSQPTGTLQQDPTVSVGSTMFLPTPSPGAGRSQGINPPKKPFKLTSPTVRSYSTQDLQKNGAVPGAPPVDNESK
jgi:hypothetical protein